MLTLKEINEISFRKSSFSGYKPEDVDKFIDEVSEAFKAIAQENQSYKEKIVQANAKIIEQNTHYERLNEKAQSLAEKLSSYKNDEEGIKNVLFNAQKLSSTTMKEARDNADKIISDANSKATAIVEQAKNKSIGLLKEYEGEISKKEKEFDALKNEITEFRAKIFEMYRTHFKNIENIPEFSEELKAKAEIKAETKEVEFVKKEVKVEPVVSKPAPQPEPVIEVKIPENKDLQSNSKAVFDKFEEIVTENKSVKPIFEEIDFDAFVDIPEALKNERATMFNTLEFGDDINISKSK